MSTQIMFAHHDGVFVSRPRVRSEAKDPVAAAALAPRPKRTSFAMTGEDISSLVTIVPVGILALITFGSLLSPI
ncbi:hypothetical protein [Sphingopyxis witflariensis]|nr:hypothetical protein [Sphingopyxis witflariensis]